jgi:hypothetical protein
VTEIIVNGFDALRSYLDLLPERAQKAASLAINQTADRKGMALIRKNMRDEAAFPSGYLEDPKRLGVTQRAKPSNLEAIIRGRSRPTSLARFASGTGRSPSVRVNPGRSKTLSRAFIVKLKAGQGPVGDNFNLGLAIRLKRDEVIANKRIMAGRGFSGLYLLYGPSVDQVFRTVAASAAPEITEQLLEEFKRQFARLGDGA